MYYSTNSKTFKASVKYTDFCDAVERFCNQTGRYRAEVIDYRRGRMFLSHQWGKMRYVWLNYERHLQRVYVEVDDRAGRESATYYGRPEVDDVAIFSILNDILM